VKTTAFVVLLATSLVSFGAEPDSKAIGKRPNGHKTLKDVPILYGLPPFRGPEAKKFREDIQAGKFVSGSDVLDSGSPRIQVTCTTCGFAHTQYSSDFGTSSRDAEDSKSFKTPFTDLVSTFPIPPPKQLRGQITYRQSMDDKLRVFAEMVHYSSAESLDAVRAKVIAWLKRRQLNLTMTTAHHKASETLDGNSRDVIQWGTGPLNSGPITIDISFEHNDRRCYINLSHSIDK
jgi:hypothetical protein